MSFKRAAAYLSDLLILAVLGVCLWMLYTRFSAGAFFIYAAVWVAAAILLASFEWNSYHSHYPAGRNSARASALVLINETQRAVSTWSLDGKTSLLVGKNIGAEVDGIDLTDTEFAILIDEQHAVLNYTASGWTIEDLHSKNGTAIFRAGKAQEQPSLIAPGVPYSIKPGDMLILAGDIRIAVK